MMMKMMRWSGLAVVPLLVALLAGSCSDNNPKVTAPTDTTPPAAITNLAAGSLTSSSVQLTWTAPGDDGSTGTANHYDIRYSTAPITNANFAAATAVTSGVPTPTAAGTSQSATVTGLSPSTPYYFAMMTADEVPNWSGLSNVVLATTTAAADVTPPAAITNLATNTVTSTTVQLAWTAPGDDGSTGTAHQYDIRYSTSPITTANFASATQVSGAPTPTAAGTSQTVTATGLTASTLYYFAMKTADEVPNWSTLSNVTQGTTLPPSGDTTPPAAITNLATGTVTASSVHLTWTAPGDDGGTGTAHQYDIRYSTSLITSANFASATPVLGAPAPTVAGTSQSVTVNGLAASTLYYFAMKTSDEVPNWSGLSNVVQATTTVVVDVTPPAAVTNLATGTVTSNSVQLTWTAPGDDGSTGTAHQYDIRYSTAAITAGNFASATPVTSGVPTPTAAGTSQSVTVNGLAASTPYYFAMKASDEVPNWSGLSNVVQATTTASADVTPPAAITSLSTGAVTSSSVHLTWTAPGDDGATGTAHQYDIRYSTSPITTGNFATATAVPGAPAPTVAGSVQSVTVSALAASTLYYFAMKTADEVPNWSGLSNVTQATTAATADVTPPAAITNLGASPADSTTVLLDWTAPGNDGSSGTAHQYDVRYSGATITEANWSAATQATGEPAPASAGTAQTMYVTGLHPGTDYFFAMKTSDAASNISALSNNATAHTPVGPSNPPGLSPLELPDSVCISSNDQWAQTAKLIATSQLAIAHIYSSLGAAFFGPIEGINWQQVGGGCWDYSYPINAGCTVDYHVCKTGDSYEYTLTYTGSCTVSSGTWVAYRAVWNNLTHTGTFYIYEPNSTTIAWAWVWTEAADQLSGTYTFYQGDPASAAVNASIEWTKSADGNNSAVTFTVPGQNKTVSTFQKNPCAGTLKEYQWNDTSTSWWLQTDIAWNPDGTGFYDTYDDTGTRIDHHVW